MTESRRTSLVATLLLLSVTAMWGSTFFLIKDLLDRVPTLDFLAVRFTIAAALLVLIAPRALARLSAESRRHAVVLGALYGLAQILQTAGLAHTAASVSGFITGMYVVATPLFAAVLLRSRITPMTWLAVLLATAGLGVLTLDGLALGYGEAITLVAAMLYALHIVGLGAWSTTHRGDGDVDRADRRDRRHLPDRLGPGRHRAPRQRSRLDLGRSTWRRSRGRSPWWRRPGHRHTWRRPVARSS